MVAHAWHPVLDAIRERVTALCARDYPLWEPGWEFDTALCNYYRPKVELERVARELSSERGKEVEWQADSISWHSDSEQDLVPDRPIASVTLCPADGVRRFDLRANVKTDSHHIQAPIQHDDIQTHLQPGSLFVMGRDTQRYYMHQVPAHRTVVGGRINITFRQTKRH